MTNRLLVNDMREKIQKILVFVINKNEFITLSIVMATIISHSNAKLFNRYYGYVAYINLALYIFLIIKNKLYRKNEKSELLLILIMLLYVLIFSWINRNSIGAIIAYLELFGALFIFVKLPLSDEGWKIVAFFCVIISLTYLIKVKDYYYLWFYNSDNYINANTISMFFYFTFLVVVYVELRSKLGNRIIYFMEWILTVYSAYAMECRTYLVATLLVGVLFFIVPTSVWMKKRTICRVIFVLFVGGMVLPYVYVSISNNVQFSLLIHQYTGKYLFTGREITWSNFYEFELSNWRYFLFGAGSWSERLFSNKYSLHNSYLGIIMNYGIIGLIIYYIYIRYLIRNLIKTEVNIEQKFMIMGFIGFLVASYSEVVLQTPISALLVSVVFSSSFSVRKS